MTHNSPEPERKNPRPDWEDFLASQLSEFELKLRSGSDHVPTSAPTLPVCPPEILAELDELRSCLALVEQYRVLQLSGEHPRSRIPLNESPTLYLPRPANPQGSIPSPPDPLPPSPHADFSDPDSELRLGRFQLGQKLGEGTYGIVYVAHDPYLKRLVALKVPRLDAAFRDDLRDRFIREGESAARLTHPNIVAVYEAIAEGPVSLIVSEYISGPNLAVWLADRENDIPPRHAARLVALLADAVAHAHSRGVLHRDIKPSNILLHPRVPGHNPTAELDQFLPKLTDFGLAKLVETGSPTVTGALLGTPGYMAPEQVAGKTSEIGPAADIYALGIILYELLTRTNPLLKETVGETIHAVTHDDLPPPSRLNPAIPRDLQTICLKCLRREPADRYGTAVELAEDLRRYLDGHPILARTVPPLERAAKWCRRYPALTLSLSATFLLLVTLLVVSYWQNLQIAEALNSAREAKILAEERAELLAQRNYLQSLKLASEAWDKGQIDSMIDLLEQYIPQPGQTDRREFVWWYLWNTCHNRSRVIARHPGGAHAVACTQTAPYLAASAGQDAIIRLLSIPDGRQIAELKGHTAGPVQSLEFSPDGKHLLSAAEDGTARIWDLETKSEIRRLAPYPDSNTNLDAIWLAVARYSPDGKVIATGGADKVIRLWDAETGLQTATLSGHTHTIRALGFQPFRTRLISSSEDDTVRLWNWKTAQPDDFGGKLPGAQFIPSHPSWGNSIDFARTEDMFALAGVGIWSLREADNFGTFLTRLNDPSRVRSAKWLLDGRLILSREDSVIRIINDPVDSTSGQELLRGHHPAEIFDISLLPNDEGLLSASRDGEVRYWAPANLKPEIEMSNWPAGGHAKILWKNDLLLHRRQPGSHGTGVSLLRLSDRTPLWDRSLGFIGRLYEVIPFPDQEHLLAAVTNAKEEHRIFALSVKNHARPAELADLKLWDKLIPKSVQFLAMNQDASLAVFSIDRTIFALDPLTGKEFKRLEVPVEITALAFLPKSPRLLVAGADGSLREYDSASLSETPVAEHHLSDSPLINLAIDPHQERIAVSSGDFHTYICSYPEVRIVSTFKHLNRTEIAAIALLDRGRTLVTRDDYLDKLVFWDVATTERLAETPIGDDDTFTVSPDGLQIAVTRLSGADILDGRPAPKSESTLAAQ